MVNIGEMSSLVLFLLSEFPLILQLLFNYVFIIICEYNVVTFLQRHLRKSANSHSKFLLSSYCFSHCRGKTPLNPSIVLS